VCLLEIGKKFAGLGKQHPVGKEEPNDRHILKYRVIGMFVSCDSILLPERPIHSAS
jgi:hypothetical protein